MPVKMVLRITDRKQLWNVCYKSQHARVEIPELEFEVRGGRGRRRGGARGRWRVPVQCCVQGLGGDEQGLSAVQSAIPISNLLLVCSLDGFS